MASNTAWPQKPAWRFGIPEEAVEIAAVLGAGIIPRQRTGYEQDFKAGKTTAADGVDWVVLVQLRSLPPGVRQKALKAALRLGWQAGSAPVRSGGRKPTHNPSVELFGERARKRP